MSVHDTGNVIRVSPVKGVAARIPPLYICAVGDGVLGVGNERSDIASGQFCLLFIIADCEFLIMEMKTPQEHVHS